MAGTLLDAVRQNSTALATQQQPGTGAQTQQASNLLAAKSGKDVVGSQGGYAQSSLGEQQAASNANTQMRTQVLPQQQAQQNQLQVEQQGQQQQTGQALQQIGQQRQFNTLQSHIQTTSILNNLEQQGGQIDMANQSAEIGQVATNLRLQNQQYVNALTISGQKDRLDNQLAFQQSMAQSIFGDNLDILNQRLGDKTVMDANTRQFNQVVANMDIGMAQDIMSRTIGASQQQAAWGGAGALVTAGVAGYGALMKPAKKTEPIPQDPESLPQPTVEQAPLELPGLPPLVSGTD